MASISSQEDFKITRNYFSILLLLQKRKKLNIPQVLKFSPSRIIFFSYSLKHNDINTKVSSMIKIKYIITWLIIIYIIIGEVTDCILDSLPGAVAENSWLTWWSYEKWKKTQPNKNPYGQHQWGKKKSWWGFSCNFTCSHICFF